MKLQLDHVKKRLGEYGKPLVVGEYKQLRMMLGSCCPVMFLLFADMYNLQAVIPVSLRLARI